MKVYLRYSYTMKTNNIFQNLPRNLDEELFTTILEKDGLKLQRIVSEAHTTAKGEWYDQADNEWFILLQGAAVISFEGEEEVKLEVGDHLNIPAHKRHRVSWTSENEQTIWLAMHYS